MFKFRKKIPNLLLDQNYMVDFFSARLTDIDPAAQAIEKIEIYPIKKNVQPRRFHLVIAYELHLKLDTAKLVKKKIMCGAFSQHQRRRAYSVLEFVYKNGFDQGNPRVPRPLWYVEELHAMFYVGVRAFNLFNKIKHNFDQSIDYYIKLTAEFLAKFHRLVPPAELDLKDYYFNWLYLDPTGILKRPGYELQEKEDIKKIELLYQRLKQQEEKLVLGENFELSHGDMHLENVMVSETFGRVTIIDFSEACRAPLEYDLGSFLQQLRFMTRGNPQVDKNKYAAWKKLFLDTYFSSCNIKVTPDNLKLIDLYQAWTALRSATFYIGFQARRREDRSKLLTSIENFIATL